ncbi:recombinase family protein [Clostridium saccharoperbutylacetonicum]|uniref:recombinase family protein n=1 Tax=Clostridium saccharoperbutylacetonicum TaxID=36745 RepID=UPI0039EA411F
MKNSKWFYYLRVSSKDQNLDRQQMHQELNSFCDRMNIKFKDLIVLSDMKSGKDFDRPQYQLLKQVASEGDNIIVSSLDRFGRNYIDGRKEFTELLAKGIKVYSLDKPMLESLYKLDDSMSKFMINFLIDWELVNAEEELKRIKKRQKEGIAAAKEKNKKFGRPKINLPEGFETVYAEWKSEKITAKKAMEKLDLKRSTFYNFVKEFEKSKKS